ncbi:MAG: hypothetical protein ACYDBJ_10085 [Aggregatilineales bacterium]
MANQEQIPLSAKQMLGTHRQFVHTPESVQRLPEFALLAGSIVIQHHSSPDSLFYT